MTLLGFPQLTDTVRAASAVADTTPPTLVESPLPGGVSEVVRYFFNLPQWFQIAGFFAGLIVAALILIYLWKRRAPIVYWIKTRERGLQLGLAGGLFGLILLASGAGMVSWNYMQHDNGFCTGCHVMNVPFGKFEVRAGKHDSLQCHNCHQQSIYASMRQLYLWVAERPEEIGSHAKVPNRVCAGCHVTGEGKEKWKNIAATAGHRVHLESDSTALKNVQCVTCHGYEVHLFVPVDRTCMQSGCHENLKIGLGKMAGQTDLHCVTCHQFTADVPRLATYDSAAKTLVPTNKQCLSCHEMQKVLTEFDPAKDPHNGACGTCHNPHTQTKAADAAKRCATSGCHDNWGEVPFHVGATHRQVVQDCLLCHNPHQARLDASDCEGCHTKVRARGRFRPPVPFDTLRALKGGRGSPPGASAGGPVTGFIGGGAWWEPPLSLSDPPPVRAVPAPAADSFPHQRHKSLACLTCHKPTATHGRLNFETPRGCQICHHVVQRDKPCTVCHQQSELDPPHVETVTITVPDRAPRARPVTFTHRGPHEKLACRDCHKTEVTNLPAADVVTCQACHDRHHGNPTTCSTCHTATDLQAVHARPIEAHRACDECHTARIVAELVPTRNLCVTCHRTKADHYPAKQCTVCHFLSDPESYRVHLRKASKAG